MHILTEQALAELASDLVVKFVEEKKGASGPINSPNFVPGKPTGRYHFTMDIQARESLTGISSSNEIVPQTWELVESIPNGDGSAHLRFKAWGGGIWADHHEGKEMMIDAQLFGTTILPMMMTDGSGIDPKQLVNAIGLECFFRKRSDSDNHTSSSSSGCMLPFIIGAAIPSTLYVLSVIS